MAHLTLKTEASNLYVENLGFSLTLVERKGLDIWTFLFPGWINSMFADSQVILKLIIKPSKPEPWGHFPIV